MNFEGNENLVAQAESRLNDYAEEKAVRELSVQKKSPAKSRRSVKTRRASRDKVVQVASNDTRRSAKAVSGRKAASVKTAKVGKSKAERASKGGKTAVRASEKKASSKMASSSHQKSKKSSGTKSRKQS